jgi:hypothetical protein
MKAQVAGILILFVMSSCSSVLFAQNLYDAPSQCAVALQQDVLSTVRSSSEQLAFLNTVDEKTFEQLKHDVSLGEVIPIPDGIVKADQSYSDFDETRKEYFQQIGFSQSKQDSESLLSLTTSSRAFTSFDKCMDDLARNNIGFSAWRISEDKNDIVLDCFFNPPPGVSKSLQLQMTALGGTFLSNHKPELKTQVGTNSHCDPITVTRSGGASLTVTVAASGYAPAVVKSAVGPDQPKNFASVTYTPIERKEEQIVVYDQRTLQPPSNETLDMNGKGGCTPGFPSTMCSRDRKHAANPWGATLYPPPDGDIIDPGQDVVAYGHDLDNFNQTDFCAQSSVAYYPVPEFQTGQAPPAVVAFYLPLKGKHYVNVIGRCWGPKAAWLVTLRQYHMVPSEKPKDGGVYYFNPGDDVVLSVPNGTPGKIQFSYGSGATDVVKPGESTSDGKIVCRKTFSFNGATTYIYRYAG